MRSAAKSRSATWLRLLLVVPGFISAGRETVVAQVQSHSDGGKQLLAVVTEPAAVTQEKAELWKKDGFDAFVLVLDERFEPADYQRAAAIVAASSVRLYYWIEVGRNKDFARDHPEWMASLGSHDDWRNSFPDAPRLNKGEVAKAWPWTPIAYQKAFDAHFCAD